MAKSKEPQTVQEAIIAEDEEAVQGHISETVRNLAFAGIGMVSIAGENLQALYQRSLKRGGETVKNMQEQREKARQEQNKLEKVVSQQKAPRPSMPEAVIAKLNLPTRDDIAKLNKQVEALEAAINQLSSEKANQTPQA